MLRQVGGLVCLEGSLPALGSTLAWEGHVVCTAGHVAALHTLTARAPHTRLITLTIFLETFAFLAFAALSFVGALHLEDIRTLLLLAPEEGLRVPIEAAFDGHFSHVFVLDHVVTARTRALGGAISISGETFAIKFEAFGFLAVARFELRVCRGGLRIGVFREVVVDGVAEHDVDYFVEVVIRGDRPVRGGSRLLLIVCEGG